MYPKVLHSISAIAGFFAILFLVISCDSGIFEPPPNPTHGDGSVDPFPNDRDPAVLERIVPTAGFAGDPAVISGSGFREGPEKNMVNIGDAVADIVEIPDTTELHIIIPENESGNQPVRVGIWGSDLWSNSLSFKYEADFLRMDFEIDNPGGIALDDENSLYISSVVDGAVYKIASAQDSVKSTYATAAVRGKLEFGPDGYLYIATTTGLSRIPPGGGSVESVVDEANIVDFDWNANGDMYLLVGGSQIKLYKGGSDTEVIDGASVSQGQQLRVFADSVYVTELFNRRVSRFEIMGDELGPKETVLASTYFLTGLDIGEDGSLYVGTHSNGTVVKARQDRENDSDIEEFPLGEDQVIEGNVGPVYNHNTVIYVITPNDNMIYRIFVGESNAPRLGRE
ncbi:MAG: IPT/TIG domain-containing protein [Balneolales bacterium]